MNWCISKVVSVKTLKIFVLFIGIVLFMIVFAQIFVGTTSEGGDWMDPHDLNLEPYRCSRKHKTTNIRADNMTIIERPKLVDLADGGSCNHDCNRVQPYTGLCVTEGNLLKKTLYRLPSLLVIGVMKGGTGAMMKYLNQHPLLISGNGENNEREVHFFTNLVKNEGGQNADSKEDCQWLSYARHFPIALSNRLRESGIIPITFDKSPDYIRSPPALRKAKKILPSVKILILLRDPVKRAISAFNHNCRHGRYWSIQSNGPSNARMRRVYKPKKVFRRLNGDTREEIKMSDVLRIEWLRQEARANALIGCVANTEKEPHIDTNTNCKVIHEADLPLYFAPLRYPCSAEHFNAYIVGALPSEFNGELNNDQQNQSMHNISRQPFAMAAEELSYGFYVSQLRQIVSIFPAQQTRKWAVPTDDRNKVGVTHPQVKVLFQEYMRHDTLQAVNDVLKWLQLSSLKSLHEIVPQALSSATLAEEVHKQYPELHRGLTKFYAQQNSGLAILLGEYGLFTGAPPTWTLG